MCALLFNHNGGAAVAKTQLGKAMRARHLEVLPDVSRLRKLEAALQLIINLRGPAPAQGMYRSGHKRINTVKRECTVPRVRGQLGG